MGKKTLTISFNEITALTREVELPAYFKRKMYNEFVNIYEPDKLVSFYKAGERTLIAYDNLQFFNIDEFDQITEQQFNEATIPVVEYILNKLNNKI
jgi:hypothetical protein